MISNSFSVNEKGNLTIGNVDTVELANQFGTPLYVFDEASIRKNCSDFKDAFDKYYNGNATVLYASKAFSCKEMYRIVKSEGLGVDVDSGGELYTALSAGFSPELIYFHGNNKTPDELEYALKNDIGRIVVDNIYEMETINEIAGKLEKKANILLRIKPGIDVHTHDFIKTGQIDCKFGFALENGEADSAVLYALRNENLNLIGIHCHIGSQIFETDPFILAAEVMIGFAKRKQNEHNIIFSEINFGGGYGIKYVESDTPVEKALSIEVLASAVKKVCSELDYPLPKIVIEPGRSIVGEASLTLYKVGAVKTIKDVRTYVSVDGGMSDNPRYALYHADYEIVIANKASNPRNFMATIAGKCCESGDLIQEHTYIQETEVGDTLAVLATGAYNYSMASNYNRICRPAAVMVKNGTPRLIIKRETYEDIVRNDI